MYVTQVAFSPSYARTHVIYVLCNGEWERYRDHRGGVIREDLGESSIPSFAIQPGKGDRIIAAMAKGLYLEAGGRWTLMSRGAVGPTPAIRFLNVCTVVAGTPPGLLLSSDSGWRWSRVATPGSTGVLAVASEAERRVVVSLTVGGVWHVELP